MNIGVYFTAQKSGGGGYQYALLFLDAILSHEDDHLIIFNTSPDLPEQYKKHPRITIVDVVHELTTAKRNRFITRIENYFRTALFLGHQFSLLNTYDACFRSHAIRQLIAQYGITLMIFPSPYNLASQLDIPTIVPIHDLQHRLSPQFPEVGSGRAHLNKEYLFSQIVRCAWRILVDSDIGKEDVINCYGKSTASRIEVLPFIPPNYLNPNISENTVNDTIRKYNLPEKFLFYPAQFWPHKNHPNLIRTLGILKNEGFSIDLVLTGGKPKAFSTFDETMRLVQELGIENRIHSLGYVDNEEMSVLYKRATALIFPTSFGPTNIPILEAWKMGCPVIYSNVRGLPEQAGDAALLIDPLNPTDIAEKIRALLHDRELQQQLTERGRKRLELWTEADFIDRVKKIINDYQTYVGR